ncbi:MAG TPA: serine protease [Isosphaeraceae bacterium]|nr:serine protease [Isosphaeraceae bacterium]
MAGREVGAGVEAAATSLELAGAAAAGRSGADRPLGSGWELGGNELNGTFLTGYDGRHAVPESSGSAVLFRKDELRVHRDRLVFEVARPDDRAANLELILDASNLLPFNFLRTGDRLGRAVVKIERADGAAGTGFLVAPDILLTNNHVLPDLATAAAARALANYEAQPAADAAGRPTAVPLDPDVLFVTNTDLDFTFCALGGLEHLGVVPLTRNSLNVLRSEYVNIVQHPRGRPKEVVVQDSRVVRADNVVVHYSSDTEPGSSGSPVFNNQWALVALHHASVVADDGRASPGADPRARYLNEGVRLSAIATWLETSEANAPGQREAVGRLRAVFRGLDPQIGFFGALGRRALGRSAAEVVVESYRGGADDLDVAYWDLDCLGRPLRPWLAEVGRVMADMNMDVWCLAEVQGDDVRALCNYLETNFRLDYGFHVDRSDATLGVVYRRAKGLSVSRPAFGALGRFPSVAIRTTTQRGEAIDLGLILVPPTPPGGDTAADRARALIATVARDGARAAPTADWLLVGDPEILRTAELVAGAGTAGLDPLVLGGEPDGALALLARPDSPIDHVFAMPYLTPITGHADRLTIVEDRDLPPGTETLGRTRPIALRIALNGRQADDSRPTDPPPPPPPAPAAPAADPPAPLAVDDAALERKLRDILPIIARLLGEAQSPDK